MILMPEMPLSLRVSAKQRTLSVLVKFLVRLSIFLIFVILMFLILVPTRNSEQVQQLLFTLLRAGPPHAPKKESLFRVDGSFDKPEPINYPALSHTSTTRYGPYQPPVHTKIIPPTISPCSHTTPTCKKYHRTTLFSFYPSNKACQRTSVDIPAPTPRKNHSYP